MSEERKECHVRMAKANTDEVEKLRQFMADLEDKVFDPNIGDPDLEEWIRENFPQWRRTIEGYPILVENACDPTLTYLDWKPEIKAVYQPTAA